jgi:CelD/BcsL family acetyltransferase involved in cellulose biosynthesis
VIELRTHPGTPTAGAAAEWELLLDEDPHATVFHTPRYLTVWQRELAGGTPTRVHTVHRDGRLIGIIPDANELQGGPSGPQEVRRFMGGTEVSDYLGPISRPEDRTDVAATYIAHLAEDVDWDELVLGGLAEDTGWADAFRRAVHEHELHIEHEDVEDVCPRVDLAGGFSAYRARLPGKLRQEMTRKARKLARDAGEFELVEVPAGEVVSQLDGFLDQAAESIPEKAGFFRQQDMHGWFKALAEEFVGDRTFRLHRLQVGAIQAASAVSLVHDGEWGLYNSAFDPTLGSLAPGMVIIPLLMEQAAAEGCGTFDLLRGDEPYKYRFGAVDRPLHRLTVVRS